MILGQVGLHIATVSLEERGDCTQSQRGCGYQGTTTRAYRRISPCVPRFSVEVFKFLTSVIIKTYLDYGLRILEASWQV